MKIKELFNLSTVELITPVMSGGKKKKKEENKNKTEQNKTIDGVVNQPSQMRTVEQFTWKWGSSTDQWVTEMERCQKVSSVSILILTPEISKLNRYNRPDLVAIYIM